MQGFWVIIPDFDAEHEVGSLSQSAAHRQSPFVQVSQRLDQSQSDASSRSLMFSHGLVVAIEDMRQRLRCYAIASIDHVQVEIVTVLVQRETDLPRGGVLDGIRHQVVCYRSDDFRIVVNLGQIGIDIDADRDLGITAEGNEVPSNLIHQSTKVSLGYHQFPIVCFGFPELQNVIDQTLQTVSVGVDRCHLLPIGLGHLAIVLQVLQWAKYQSKWRAQFVSNIREEA